MHWLQETLRLHPEIALFVTVAIAYPVGLLKFRGFGLGTVTATLLVGILVGQFGVQISPNVEGVFFFLFLFAVGYSVGPQFVRGIAHDGGPQALFAVVVCALTLATSWGVARLAGYDLGYAAGLYAGAATISSALGLSANAISHLPGDPAGIGRMTASVSTAFAMTYIFGTVGSAFIIAQLGPRLLRIDPAAACRAYEARMGAGSGSGADWHHFVVRAFRIPDGSRFADRSVAAIETMLAGKRVYIEAIHREGAEVETVDASVVRAGDVVVASGASATLGRLFFDGAEEVDDPALCDIPDHGVEVVVTNRAFDGRTLGDLAGDPVTRGLFIRSLRRGAAGIAIPILAGTEIHRGDVLTVVGRPRRIAAAVATVGRADFSTNETDITFLAGMIAAGALVGAPLVMVGALPVTLSVAGGVLIAGLVAGWVRSVHPTFGHIPPAAVWFMNTIGLNAFIAVVGIASGPGFVDGVREVGASLFLWGMVVTTVPLVLSLYLAKYVFRFDDALVLGCCAGARVATAALGMVTDSARSQVPALGYTVPYAVSNTLLTIGGILIVMLMR